MRNNEEQHAKTCKNMPLQFRRARKAERNAERNAERKAESSVFLATMRLASDSVFLPFLHTENAAEQDLL